MAPWQLVGTPTLVKQARWRQWVADPQLMAADLPGHAERKLMPQRDGDRQSAHRQDSQSWSEKQKAKKARRCQAKVETSSNRKARRRPHLARVPRAAQAHEGRRHEPQQTRRQRKHWPPHEQVMGDRQVCCRLQSRPQVLAWHVFLPGPGRMSAPPAGKRHEAVAAKHHQHELGRQRS